jgi:exopolyphosphatase / guanosine-5'-triphosphate,3'-diphosphate pyrophosphatase
VIAAVVDVGSNSVRLLLMERMDRDGAVGERVLTVTGLRRGASADGTVTAQAIARLDSCLADYAVRIAAAGSPPVLAVGTSAVRDAPNRAEVEAVVQQRLGTALRVVSGGEEAALSFAGARLVMGDRTGPCTVIDIGGGSTEVVEGDGGGPGNAVSLQLGVNRQGEMITADPPPPHEVQAISDEAERMVREATVRFAPTQLLVGVAGTVTTVAAVMLGRYDPVAIHGMHIGRDDVQRVLAGLAGCDADERARTPGLHADRVNVIVPGLAILLGCLDALGVTRLVVSERDILDGIAMEALRDGDAATP